ncbi:hypothetical protein R3P38DRAFT_2792110 [Favolaschia claudopus]|uniref:Uncharacterized protein n=1 Tax=Favolaschia claudopus TaxID=2862362 RepID=A0AAW0AFG2_9AGAR
MQGNSCGSAECRKTYPPLACPELSEGVVVEENEDMLVPSSRRAYLEKASMSTSLRLLPRTKTRFSHSQFRIGIRPRMIPIGMIPIQMEFTYDSEFTALPSPPKALLFRPLPVAVVWRRRLRADVGSDGVTMPPSMLRTYIAPSFGTGFFEDFLRILRPAVVDSELPDYNEELLYLHDEGSRDTRLWIELARALRLTVRCAFLVHKFIFDMAGSNSDWVFSGESGLGATVVMTLLYRW